MEGRILERAARLAATTLRVCGWLLAWTLLFLAVRLTPMTMLQAIVFERDRGFSS